MSTTAKIRWSQNHPTEEVPVNQLTRCLDAIVSKCKESGMPFILDVTAHGYQMMFGLGLAESFVHVEAETGEPPYFITVGDPTAEGGVAFYLHGTHHTEIPRRNLISTVEAVRVAQEFLERGTRSESVKWEEV